MALKCNACGETNEFRKTTYGRARYSETTYINGDGDVIETDNTEYDDHDITDEDNPECDICGSSDIDTDYYPEDGGPVSNSGVTVSNLSGVIDWKETYKYRNK